MRFITKTGSCYTVKGSTVRRYSAHDMVDYYNEDVSDDGQYELVGQPYVVIGQGALLPVDGGTIRTSKVTHITEEV